MSAQRYTQQTPRERMAHNLCPECGNPAAMHSDDIRFWVPRRCDLLPQGVEDRIAQYRADVTDRPVILPLAGDAV